MTTEEKIQHITEVTIENTQKECDRSLYEYKKRMEKYYEEKKNDAKKKAELKIQIAKDDIVRKTRKECANEQLHLKRKISDKQDELKDRLKKEVERQIGKFRETQEYMAFLENKIRTVKKLAAGNSINIYIDANDKDKKEILEERTKCRLLIFKNFFLGGIIAEIPIKNILIDYSFETKLEEIMEEYTLKL